MYCYHWLFWLDFNCFIRNKHCLLACVIEASLGVVSTSFSFAFSLTVENVKRNKIKKYEIKRKEIIILLLTRGILNSIVSTISKSVINSKISHENLSIKSQL